jgi:hypothetical protein
MHKEKTVGLLQLHRTEIFASAYQQSIYCL